jgi:predicted protein tyrosine phosphatase
MRSGKINTGAAFSSARQMSSSLTPIHLPTPTKVEKYSRVSRNANQVDSNIFIGNANSARDSNFIKSQGITNIINCAKELPNFLEGDPTLHYLKLGLDDGVDQTSPDDDLYRVVEGAYRYISIVLKNKPESKFLIHCQAGISRSASVTIYYLMRKEGIDYDTALNQLRDIRPIVSPNRWFEKQLRDMNLLMKEERLGLEK